MEQLTLALPSLALEAACRACATDFARVGESFLGRMGADFAHYIEWANGMGPVPPGLVRQTDYFLLRDGTTVLGRSSLRHALDDSLRDIGGHIGYCIRPSERRKGYGTRLLALTLAEARALGLREVLLTCDSDNVGSRRVIERNGGRLASESPGGNGVLVARYLIEVPPGDARG